MKAVNPYLLFQGNTEEVFKFYQSVFGGKLQIVRYKDLDNNMGASGEDLNKIANVALPVGKNAFLMGNDVLDSFNIPLTNGNNFSLNLETENIKETERLFEALSQGGQSKMPVQETEWAERFGMCVDKFGVEWSFNYPGNKGA